MSSKIEQLIDEIEGYIEGCKHRLINSNEIIVDKDRIDELLRELRLKTPEEIKRYQKIINNKDAILSDARAKAESLIKEATIQTNELINEHQIMQQAYAQANEIVEMAKTQGQDILDSATIEANSVRAAAMQYMDDILSHLDEIITSSTQAATGNYESLIGNLNQYHEIIASNRLELHPEDEMDEVIAEETGNQENKNQDLIDVIS